ncbi:unnamed protein product, partial [Closterium sp. NIES-53]
MSQKVLISHRICICVETSMHLTCTNMPVERIDQALLCPLPPHPPSLPQNHSPSLSPSTPAVDLRGDVDASDVHQLAHLRGDVDASDMHQHAGGAHRPRAGAHQGLTHNTLLPRVSLNPSSPSSPQICVETSMHLTCTNMPVERIDHALEHIKAAGLQNVLALRGDPPHGQDKFVAAEGGFSCALDLVKHIRAKYGDYFGITVAGYP